MKKYLVLVSLIAVVSTLALVISDIRNADVTGEELDGDPLMDYVGV